MRRYYLFGELNDGQAQNIISFLLKCKMDNEDAVMLINSHGGITAGMDAIYEVLVDTGVHLTTIGMGMVASAAANIFAMGDERIILPGTEYLIHYPSDTISNAVFTQYDYEMKIMELALVAEKIIRMYEKTKITSDIFSEKCSKGQDWSLTPEELKAYEVITQENYNGWSNIVIETMNN